ncbi:FlaA1/EpsC-like NDP-sugar epimerase [Ereboglobus sp. PH5-5]|uniref:hypothetical protein n=1 Tax=Ereboglobus sp. PH5-5 TaxID=2940529 RepID=UPI002406C061|nr:hypothetical protein [Ereboglobus sp. PH5-5]MDF9834004.1 FlaA1/EpsC-like NDP-sugar epimerase [Ereboglobus sp. PH5-5]
MPKKLLVTGSSGLIGSEVCTYFARELGCAVPEAPVLSKNDATSLLAGGER